MGTTVRARSIRTLYSVDDMVEKVWARLEALSEVDNTIAFFLSDNGYMWMEHRLNLKNYAYEDSVRLPFFVRGAGFQQGAVDNRIVANIDIAPTIYDILDFDPPHSVDGRSLFTSNRNEILTEGWGYDMPFRSLWKPSSMYAEYDNGFREYYAPDDPWQLDNGFKTGDPPANAVELANRLDAASTCQGAAARKPRNEPGKVIPCRALCF
jgi:arylsulfatase A-like enzyme